MKWKEKTQDFVRTYIKKQPYNPQLTDAERNDLLIGDFNNWLRRDTALALSVARFSPNRNRLICKGVYIGGEITLRLDKNSGEQQVLREIEDLKNDIFTVGREFKAFYPAKEISFVRFYTSTNLSYDIVYRVGAEEKTVNYRPYGYPLEDSLKNFFIREAEGQVIAGTFIVGERKFIQLLNENRGKAAHIEIEPHRAVRGVS